MSQPILAKIGTYLGLDRAATGYGLRLALAAWLAFALASLLHIENPYWAAMPVWVVAQASRGLLLERAFFRIVGTLIGAGVGFGLMHVPASPYLVLALLGLWIALTAGLTHLLRGMHYYGALMAGMTAAIVVLPSIWTPDAALGVATARVECTLIGVLVVTLVNGFLTPAARRREFYQRARQAAGAAVAHAAELLQDGGERGAGTEIEAERRILGGLSTLENTAPLVTAGSLEGYRRLRHVDSLVVASLSVMAAAAALRARARAGQAVPAGLVQHLERLASYLRQAPAAAAPEMPVLAPETGGNPLDRLERALRQLLAAATALGAAGEQVDAQADAQADTQADAPVQTQSFVVAERLAPHREWVLARRTGLISGLLSFAASALGYRSGLPATELAALGVCIFSMVLGSMALPQKVAPSLLKGILVGVATATLYRFLWQPHITTIFQLLLSVAPFILVGGLARASKRFAIAAIDYNMGFLLASQAVLPAVSDPAAIWSGALALIGVAALVAGSFILLPRDAGRQAIDAAATVRRDLQRLIAQHQVPDGDWQARTSRQILRLALHLGRAGELAQRLPAGMLALLNLGYAIGDLHAAAQRLRADPDAQRSVAQALDLLAGGAELPDLTAARLRLLAADARQTALAALLDELAAALAEAAALLAFGASQRRHAP